MDKIKISKIAEEVHALRGFDEQGCLGSPCGDICCEHGADVDREAFDLILKHKDKIEYLNNIKFEDFFEGEWSGDSDFLGGNSIRSKVGASGRCIFRVPDNKGCILFKLVMQEGLPRRIIPSICRLFPLTWDNGLLEYYDKGNIPITCNCLEIENTTTKSVFETQQDAIEDIFEIIS